MLCTLSVFPEVQTLLRDVEWILSVLETVFQKPARVVQAVGFGQYPVQLLHQLTPPESDVTHSLSKAL